MSVANELTSEVTAFMLKNENLSKQKDVRQLLLALHSSLRSLLTGTVLVPVLVSKVKELTGVDISDLSNLLLGQDGNNKKTNSKGKKKKKKTAGKKSASS